MILLHLLNYQIKKILKIICQQLHTISIDPIDNLKFIPISVIKNKEIKKLYKKKILLLTITITLIINNINHKLQTNKTIIINSKSKDNSE